MKKYELEESTIQYGERKLHRIRALRDFGNVKKGDIGGFVESESNLSHEGTCWIYDNTKVYDKARVSDNATIHGDTIIKDRALVCDNASIYGNAIIRDNTIVKCNSEICGNAVLKDNQVLMGKLISKVEDFIEIKNPEGRLVTCVLKDNKLLFNIGCQKEMTEDEFIDRIKNEDGGLENNPHREYYLKIIEMAKYYFKIN